MEDDGGGAGLRTLAWAVAIVRASGLKILTGVSTVLLRQMCTKGAAWHVWLYSDSSVGN